MILCCYQVPFFISQNMSTVFSVLGVLVVFNTVTVFGSLHIDSPCTVVTSAHVICLLQSAGGEGASNGKKPLPSLPPVSEGGVMDDDEYQEITEGECHMTCGHYCTCHMTINKSLCTSFGATN